MCGGRRGRGGGLRDVHPSGNEKPAPENCLLGP